MIYLILDETNTKCKIGVSINPEKRLKQLQTGNWSKLRLDSVIAGSFKEEKEFHTKFKDARENKEWFFYTQEIKDMFQSNTPTDFIIWNEATMLSL